MGKSTSYQGGSTISFIIVTILAVILLIGGAVWLRNRGDVAREVASSDTSEVVSEDEGEAAKSGDKDKAKKSTSGSASDKSTSSDGASSTNESSSSVGEGSSTGESATSADGETEYLPESGPAETLAAVTALGALTYAAARYVDSRRQLGFDFSAR